MAEPKDHHAWNALEVLELVNPESGKRTCPALKDSGKKTRCKNLTPSATRENVEKTLDQFSRSDPSLVLQDEEGALTALAKSLVCWRHGKEEKLQFVVGRFQRLISDEVVRQQKQQPPLMRIPRGLLMALASGTLGDGGDRSFLRSAAAELDQPQPSRSVKRSANRATGRAITPPAAPSPALVVKKEPETPRRPGLGKVVDVDNQCSPAAPNKGPQRRDTSPRAPVDTTTRRRQTVAQPTVDDPLVMQIQRLTLRNKELEGQAVKLQEEKRAAQKQLKVAKLELRKVERERDAYSTQIDELNQELNEKEERDYDEDESDGFSEDFSRFS